MTNPFLPSAGTATAEPNPFATAAPAAQPATQPTIPSQPAAPVQPAAIDPFGTSGPDEFSDARSGFLTAKDFDGCLVIIDVTGPKGSRTSKTNGQPYDYVQCDVTRLDGPPSDKLPPIGTTVDVQLTGGALLPAIVGKMGKGYPAQRVLGRMTSGPSRINADVKAYWLAEPVESDRVLARQWLAAQRAKAATADPFGVH